MVIRQWARRTGDANPTRGVALRELPDVEARAWEDFELVELRAAADGLDDGSIVLERSATAGAGGIPGRTSIGSVASASAAGSASSARSSGNGSAPVRGRILTPRPGIDVPIWHG